MATKGAKGFWAGTGLMVASIDAAEASGRASGGRIKTKAAAANNGLTPSPAAVGPQPPPQVPQVP
jgi:hypothetical protein